MNNSSGIQRTPFYSLNEIDPKATTTNNYSKTFKNFNSKFTSHTTLTKHHNVYKVGIITTFCTCTDLVNHN